MHTMEHTAGAIYVVRNPLDMVISHAHHYGKTIDESIVTVNEDAKVAGGEISVFEVHCSWSRNVESWTARPSPALHIMRYEDMRARPVEAFGGLVQFLRQMRSEEHTSELQSLTNLVCRLLLEKKMMRKKYEPSI